MKIIISLLCFCLSMKCLSDQSSNEEKFIQLDDASKQLKSMVERLHPNNRSAEFSNLALNNWKNSGLRADLLNLLQDNHLDNLKQEEVLLIEFSKGGVLYDAILIPIKDNKKVYLIKSIINENNSSGSASFLSLHQLTYSMNGAPLVDSLLNTIKEGYQGDFGPHALGASITMVSYLKNGKLEGLIFFYNSLELPDLQDTLNPRKRRMYKVQKFIFELYNLYHEQLLKLKCPPKFGHEVKV